ncbi:CsbD family protein [Oscillatoria sp. CS-180]|uniref:CsbD family protein n=1 Tax=Oscillatoria sp. CS-180 TaxID=3021720 RepID=UPI00232B9577|nr:CsbD family protein [Oscillatoria sp. CS-180]MDB9526691.1 CsbD family protein [Oscillatoria sp. CS-180]
MTTEDRVDATLKNLEGKVQEAVGEFTGDPKDKAQGKAKQIDAEATHAKEDLKDEIDKRLS